MSDVEGGIVNQHQIHFDVVFPCCDHPGVVNIDTRKMAEDYVGAHVHYHRPPPVVVEVDPRQAAIDRALASLDAWEASYEIGPPLPEHWGIRARIENLRAVLAVGEA